MKSQSLFTDKSSQKNQEEEQWKQQIASRRRRSLWIAIPIALFLALIIGGNWYRIERKARLEAEAEEKAYLAQKNKVPDKEDLRCGFSQARLRFEVYYDTPVPPNSWKYVLEGATDSCPSRIYGVMWQYRALPAAHPMKKESGVKVKIITEIQGKQKIVQEDYVAKDGDYLDLQKRINTLFRQVYSTAKLPFNTEQIVKTEKRNEVQQRQSKIPGLIPSEDSDEKKALQLPVPKMEN